MAKNELPVSLDLQSVQLFHGLKPSELERVRKYAIPKSCQAGHFLFYEGDPADYLYLVSQGKIKLTQLSAEGHQVLYGFMTTGYAFGIVAALSEIPYPVAAQAVEDSRLLAWRHIDILELMQETPQLAVNSLLILAEWVRGFQDRIRELANERVERRIARTLLRLAHQTGRSTSAGILIDLPLSRQDLAEMTGTTLYTVSRTLSKWEADGLIQVGRERVVIVFAHGLVTIAEDLPA